MGALFKNWFWGKVHADDYKQDYGVVSPRLLNKPVTALLVPSNDGAVLTPTTLSTLKVKTTFNNIIHEPCMGFDMPQQLIISTKQKEYNIKLTVDIQRIVMKEKSNIVDGESAYRYIANEHLTGKHKGITKQYNTSSLPEIVSLLNTK